MAKKNIVFPDKVGYALTKRYEKIAPPAPQPSDPSFKKIDINALVRETLAKKGIGLNG